MLVIIIIIGIAGLIPIKEINKSFDLITSEEVQMDNRIFNNLSSELVSINDNEITFTSISKTNEIEVKTLVYIGNIKYRKSNKNKIHYDIKQTILEILELDKEESLIRNVVVEYIPTK